MKSFWRGTAWVTAIVGAIGLLLYLLVFDTWVVPADDATFTVSIAPNLRPGDRLLTRRGSSPTIGQLARCANPQKPGKYVVGRVFGLDRDTVEIKSEHIIVDSQPIVPRIGCPQQALTHPVTGDIVQLNCSVEENPAWSYQTLHSASQFAVETDVAAQVEVGNAYLISDNRHLHADSRDYGMVDVSTCEHIVFRLWGESYVDASRRFTILW